MSDKLLVRQCGSEIGRPNNQRLILKGLGLRGVGSSVVVDNARAMRGMVRKVLHLVEVEEVQADAVKAPAAKGKKVKS